MIPVPAPPLTLRFINALKQGEYLHTPTLSRRNSMTLPADDLITYTKNSLVNPLRVKRATSFAFALLRRGSAWELVERVLRVPSFHGACPLNVGLVLHGRCNPRPGCVSVVNCVRPVAVRVL